MILMAGDPTLPISIDGDATADRRPFGFDEPSKFMRIIVLQSSSGPNQLPLLTDRHCRQSGPFPSLRQVVQSSGTGSEFQPAKKTPAAVLRAVPAPSTNRRQQESFRYARPPRWRGRN